MKTVMLNAAIGEEVTLKNGNASLVVKVANNKIVPDFVDCVTSLVMNDPKPITIACDMARHGHFNAEKTLRETLANKRDELFMSIKSEDAPEEPATTVTAELQESAQ